MNEKAKALRDILHWCIMNEEKEYAKRMRSFYWDVANQRPVVVLENETFFDQLEKLSIQPATPFIRDDAEIYTHDICGITFKTVVLTESKNRVTA